MDLTLVSHTHWDREWYRTFQGFRARLVDTIDRVLELVDEDPEFRFLLDGQTIVLEDYLEIRPQNRERLETACRSGRIGVGPWYVQPDSLLPQGETQIRNLLEGRRVGEPFGGVSSVAYTPDSFGHPAQFPQLFAGFGLGPFVYWRGNGNEIDSLPAEYRWEAPDGSSVLVHHLSEGYFAACGLPEDAMAAAAFLQDLALRLKKRSRHARVLLMNGIDHAGPDARAGHKLDTLARATGWQVRRGLLEDFTEGLPAEAPVWRGELTGARVANLLPGVWSARMPIKQRNRAAETALLAWAEPFAALGRVLGAPDETPSLRRAWRALLPNQAHDSLCGCSRDLVHEQSIARYDEAEELAAETTQRLLERIAGSPVLRRTPWSDALDIAVFNPTAAMRTEVVRIALDAEPWLEFRGEFDRSVQVHPFLGAAQNVAGYTVDGVPARLVEDGREGIRMAPELAPRSVEFVAHDVPAYGWRRLHLAPSAAHPDAVDSGRSLECDGIRLEFAEDGTFALEIAGRAYAGLGAIEEIGDRGDTYDFDAVDGASAQLLSVSFERRRHVGGVVSVRSRRVFRQPAALAPGRRSRSEEVTELVVELEVRLVPGTCRVDLDCRIEDTALDHRLRMLFPTGVPTRDFRAATTSDIAERSTARRDDRGWVHPAGATFCQQGFIAVGGLVVAAPGLPEAEVTPAGEVAITLLRKVGWLARTDLDSRPEPAGPMVATPGAQLPTTFRVRLCLLADTKDAPAAAAAAEAGFRAVVAGPAPLVAPEVALLRVEPPELLLEALKPTESGGGLVLRLLNPTDAPVEACVTIGFPVAGACRVRLDESRLPERVAVEDGRIRCGLGPHELLSLELRPS
ncbi:MAG: glycosyl hydrolase-related protein [Deltaproteobacteria bacterium]